MTGGILGAIVIALILENRQRLFSVYPFRADALRFTTEFSGQQPLQCMVTTPYVLRRLYNADTQNECVNELFTRMGVVL